RASGGVYPRRTTRAGGDKPRRSANAMNVVGPIFRYELTRIARRQRLTLGRCAFALVLSGIAAFVYIMAYNEPHGHLSMRDFGGVEPMIVLLAAAALGATIWSVGSLAMLWSVYARTPRAAAQRTGQLLALYFMGTIITKQLLVAFQAAALWPLGSPVTLWDIL